MWKRMVGVYAWASLLTLSSEHFAKVYFVRTILGSAGKFILSSISSVSYIAFVCHVTLRLEDINTFNLIYHKPILIEKSCWFCEIKKM